VKEWDWHKVRELNKAVQELSREESPLENKSFKANVCSLIKGTKVISK
jgi:hypothetical protein